MLRNRQDVIACDFVSFYMRDASVKLFQFCLRNQNEIFLKYALNQGIFKENDFLEQNIKTELMTMLRLKLKTTFVLNVCLFADLTKWG